MSPVFKTAHKERENGHTGTACRCVARTQQATQLMPAGPPAGSLEQDSPQPTLQNPVCLQNRACRPASCTTPYLAVWPGSIGRNLQGTLFHGVPPATSSNKKICCIITARNARHCVSSASTGSRVHCVQCPIHQQQGCVPKQGTTGHCSARAPFSSRHRPDTPQKSAPAQEVLVFV